MEPDIYEIGEWDVIETEGQLLGAATELETAALKLHILAQNSRDAYLINAEHFDTVGMKVTNARRHLLVAKQLLQERNRIKWEGLKEGTGRE